MHVFRRSFAIAIFFVTAASGPAASLQLPDALTARITDRAERFHARLDLPGLAVAVVVGDDIVYERGFGRADLAADRPVTPRSLFQIGSMTKSFTGTLLAILVERGAIGLDDPISRYLPPDLPAPPGPDGETITVRHLATHSSGLPRQPATLRRPHGDYPVLAFTHFELYQSVKQATTSFRPGSRFAYSNFGFALLGHLLERAADKPYETLLRDEIFIPLRMRSSTVTLWPELAPRLARPYYRNRSGELEDYTPWDLEAFAPAGGISSTVQDLARYAAHHSTRGSAARLTHDTTIALNDSTAYGLGWVVHAGRPEGRVIEHGGEVDGYTSYLAFAQDSRVAVIILTNTGDTPLADLGDWVLAEVARSPAIAPDRPR